MWGCYSHIKLSCKSPTTSALDNKIPIKLLFTDVPLFRTKGFYCTFFIHILSPKHDKFAAKAIQCIFISYPSHQKRFNDFDPITHRECVNADVTFYEFQPFFPKSSSSSLMSVSYSSNGSTCLVSVTSQSYFFLIALLIYLWYMSGIRTLFMKLHQIPT